MYISSASDDPGNKGRRVYNSANIPRKIDKNKNYENNDDKIIIINNYVLDKNTFKRGTKSK